MIIAKYEYEVLDSMNHITLADSFVTNKIGTAHGEAKLYVGNEGSRIHEFFDDLNRDCFFVLDDFEKYLLDAKEEYYHPQQKYRDYFEMPVKYQMLQNELNSFAREILPFRIFRKDVEPPRVYIQSDSVYYEFVRSAGLPNISYLSILKLKDSRNKIVYYFRIFMDNNSGVMNYKRYTENEEEKRIRSSNLSPTEKTVLIQARNGQGVYRRKVLEICPVCPISLVDDERLLIASHIKPWASSNDYEKMDPKNGFAFCPHYDALFDKGFMTFDSTKHMIVSPWISPVNQQRLGIYTGKLIPLLPLDAERERYMEYHRLKVFKG